MEAVAMQASKAQAVLLFMDELEGLQESAGMMLALHRQYLEAQAQDEQENS